MAKIIGRWWSLMSIALLVGIYMYGYREMFFHQDDLDWLIMANKPFWQVMESPVGDHVNYVFRALFFLEWRLFHLNFTGYLMISVLIHAVVVGLLYYLARETSGRRDLATVSALIFSVNMNWSETILWVSGQTITITALFVMLAMVAIWKKKYETVGLWIASWTSALSLGLLAATAVTDKRNRWKAGGLILIVFLIYSWRGGDGTEIEIGWKWIYQVIMVWGLMMINSSVGRLIIPFDRFETLRIWIVSLLGISSGWVWKEQIRDIGKDKWSRFLLLQIGIYYLIVALGRAQYGIGIMRADRYAYLGLALMLLLAVRILRKWNPGRWIWMVPVVVIAQCGGLYVKARAYVERPQQMRALFGEIQAMDPSQIDKSAYLPHFVLNDERLRYGDLLQLMHN